MAKKMKSLIAYGHNDFKLEEKDIPKLKQGEILLKVKAAGICAADRKILHGPAPWDLHFPFTPGHEFVGEVVDLKGDVFTFDGKKVEVGDHLTAEQIVPCRECELCFEGDYNLCQNPRILGGAIDGGFAEYMVLPKKSILWKIPEEISYEDAVLIEPLACALHGVHIANVSLKDTVVIAGLGPIGLCMLKGLVAKNPMKIIALDIDQAKLEKAKELGADYVFNPLEENSAEKIIDISGHYGPNIYLEASGNVNSINLAVDVLRPGGHLVIFGVYNKKAEVDFTIISDFKELKITGGHLSPYQYPVAIKFIQEGLINPADIISHKFPLERAVEAIEYTPKKGEFRGKVIIVP